MKNTIKISNEKELYKIIPKELREEYSVGMHGFDGGGRYWERTEKGEYQLNQDKIEETKSSILNNGLKFQKGRMLLSTASFGDLSPYIIADGIYSAGGVIIALPKTLRSEAGDEMYVGGPNEENVPYQNWDRNTQATSLSEVILPEEDFLDAMFIIGTYSKNQDGIEALINPNHIAFNKNVVSNNYFQEKQVKLEELMNDGKIDEAIINETNRQKQNKTVLLTKLGRKSYQHFGRKIAEKLKETLSILKNRFFSKDEKEGEKDGR